MMPVNATHQQISTHLYKVICTFLIKYNKIFTFCEKYFSKKQDSTKNITNSD